MDSAVDKGATVTLLTSVKNPVDAARYVLDKTPHAAMAGPHLDLQVN